MNKIFITIILAALASGPAFCAIDLMNGSDEQGEIGIGFYHPTGSGTQDYVREFDGRTLSFGAIDYLNILGYNGPWQYSVYGRYLLAHDDDTAIRLNYRNLFGVTFYQSMLTHRLGTIPASDPALIGTPAAGGADFTDFSPGTFYHIDRNVEDFNFRFSPGGGQFLRIVGNSWLQSKEGVRQQQFRARETKGIVTNRQKGSAALPVNSDTSQSSIGPDIRIGSAVVNYRYTDTKFGEGQSSATPGSRFDFSPLNRLTMVDSDTKSSVFKMRQEIGKRLFLTGVTTNTKRSNTRASLVNGTAVSINSTNVALTYLATDSLTLTGRYRVFNQDSNNALVGSGSSSNRSLSNSLRSSLIEAVYTGVPRAYFKLGYEARDVSRQNVNGTPEAALLHLSSRSDIVTGSVRYYPNSRLSLSANGSTTKGGVAGYAGVANDVDKLNANATYMIGDNFALYADYNQFKERNDQIRVPWTKIPATGANDEDAELRHRAAGQGYHNNITTSTLGAWYAFNSRLVMDANYANIQTDAAGLWIIGETSPTYITDVVSYDTQSDQWSVGLTYSFSPKWRTYGRYAQEKSDGRNILDPTKFPSSIGPTWTPVSVRQKIYTIGFACDVSIRDSLSLNYSFADWTDAVNSANDGIYDNWQLAWSHQF